VLFSETDLLTATGCHSCGLWRKCLTPRMKVSGKGKKRILIVGEAPGATEDDVGKHFVGKSGILLRKELKRIQVDLEQDCRIVNAVNCRPPKNRKVTSKEIDACRSMVWTEIRKNKPKVVLLLGKSAIESVIGVRWKKDLGGVSRWRGLAIPDKEVGGWIVSTYHPAFLLRQTQGFGQREKINEGLLKIFRNDLVHAVSLACGNKQIPPCTGILPGIHVLKTEKEALRYLGDLIRRRPPLIAFDYETTGLKPYEKNQEIVSVAFSEDGREGTAMMLSKSLIPLLRTILNDPNIEKIAANFKFEDVWSRVFLKTKVRGWVWDTMLAAHVENNREKYTSLSFQSYIQFGVPDYDSEIVPLLKSKKGKLNRVREIPETKLLMYNGIDAVFEFRLAQWQRRMLDGCYK